MLYIHKPTGPKNTSATNRNKTKLIGLAVVALGIASCGSSSLTAAKSTTSTSSVGNSQASFQACLAAHGYTFPKYNPNSKVPPTTVPASVRQAAFAACSNGSRTKRFALSPAQKQALQAYTTCLTTHGVVLPTTTTSANGTGNGKGFTALRTLRQSPNFAAASKVCSSLRPAFRGFSGRNFIHSTTTTTPVG